MTPRIISFILVLIVTVCSSHADTLSLKAKETLTAVEMNHGDVLRFELKNGQTRVLEIVDTGIKTLLTNLSDLKKGRPGGGTVYQFICRVRIDGQPIRLLRYIPVQESYYEPYVINGLRIWFDGIRKIGDLFNENHGACVPKKDVRFALQDATLPVCPQPLTPWYPNQCNQLDVHEAYNGDDVWMGTYFGADLHGGLDINMPIGTPLWAPIDFDDQFYFNSIAMGHNNNRWRAIRRWPNGDRWVLQVHHLLELLVDEHEPLKQGDHYAAAAGELTGSHAHSHFVFKIGEDGEEILLDPWILFWQIFENNREKSRAVHAKIEPCRPARTGEAVSFSSRGSRAGATGNPLSNYWTFGDGGWSNEANPTHVFSEAGMYPVTLTVDDGTQLDSFIQHISVSGDPIQSPVLVLEAPEEVSFRKRPAHSMNVYNCPPSFIPHTLQFTARPKSRPIPDAKTIEIENAGRGILREAKIKIDYHESSDWLTVTAEGEGNNQTLTVSVNAKGMKPKHGLYHATVYVACAGAFNSPQAFRVEMETPRYKPKTHVVVDDRSDDCYVTPYFWLSPRFHGEWCRGYGGSYRMNGGKATSGEYVRFQPDLARGKYRIAFAETTPFRPADTISGEIGFHVRVRHKNGIDRVWIEPQKGRLIGTFEFDEGKDGFVEILAEGSKGLVVADAVVFERIGD